jgi:uncharacterized protein (DUF2062 family)
MEDAPQPKEQGTLRAAWRTARPKLRAAWTRLRGGELTPQRAALSVAIGLAIGVLPLYGVHWLLVVGVCMPLRLDVPVAYLAANVSIPVLAPFLLLAEVQLGALALSGSFLPLGAEAVWHRGPGEWARELVVGTAIFSPLLAVTGGLLTFALVWAVRRARGTAGGADAA